MSESGIKGNGGGEAAGTTASIQQNRGQSQTSKGKPKRCARKARSQTKRSAKNGPKSKCAVKKSQGTGTKSAGKLKKAIKKGEKNGKVMKSLKKIENKKKKAAPKKAKKSALAKSKGGVKKSLKGKRNNKKPSAMKKNAIKASMRNKSRTVIDEENVEIAHDKEKGNQNLETEPLQTIAKCSNINPTSDIESSSVDKQNIKTIFYEFESKYKEFCMTSTDGKERLEEIQLTKVDKNVSNFFSVALESKPQDALQIVRSNIKISQMQADGTGSETTINRVCYVKDSPAAASAFTGHSANEIEALPVPAQPLQMLTSKMPKSETQMNAVVSPTCIMPGSECPLDVESILMENPAASTIGDLFHFRD